MQTPDCNHSDTLPNRRDADHVTLELSRIFKAPNRSLELALAIRRGLSDKPAVCEGLAEIINQIGIHY